MKYKIIKGTQLQCLLDLFSPEAFNMNFIMVIDKSECYLLWHLDWL